MDCNCPDDGILEAVPSSDCPFDLKQIQRLIFATQGKVLWDSATGGGAGNGVPVVGAQLDTLADWTPRLTAVDNTKMIITPFVGGDPQIEAGEAITEGGGDNTTLNGVEEVTGANPSLFSATFKSLSPAQEKSLKKVTCKSTEVYFVTEAGKIAAFNVEGTQNVRGFNMQSYFFSDRNNAGFGSKDSNTMRFSLASGWSEDLVLIEPADFNALYDLENA